MGQAEGQDDEPDLEPRYESVQRAQQSRLEQKDRKVNQEKLCNNSRSGNAQNQTCFNRYCGVKVSRADFELYNNGEKLFGTRMPELILCPRNSVYNKGDY